MPGKLPVLSQGQGRAGAERHGLARISGAGKRAKFWRVGIIAVRRLNRVPSRNHSRRIRHRDFWALLRGRAFSRGRITVCASTCNRVSLFTRGGAGPRTEREPAIPRAGNFFCGLGHHIRTRRTLLESKKI